MKANVTVWPTEVSARTEDGRHTHIHTSGKPRQEELDAMVGRAVRFCVENGAEEIVFRFENADD